MPFGFLVDSRKSREEADASYIYLCPADMY